MKNRKAKPPACVRKLILRTLKSLLRKPPLHADRSVNEVNQQPPCPPFPLNKGGQGVVLRGPKALVSEANTFILIIAFVLIVTVNPFAFSKTIFHDDFEKEKVGKPPSKWVGCPEDGKIFEDPLKPGNLVMGVIKQNVDCGIIADTDNLSEYTVEWHWMWQNAEWHSMTIHQEKPGENYHFARNPDGNAWEMWVRTGGNWPGPFVVGQHPTDLNKWYRCQFSVKEADIVFKIKEKDDNTDFDKIKSVVEMHGEDNRFKRGKFGVNENPGSFLDNVLIYFGKPSPVEREGKLTTTFGVIKSR